MAKFLNFIFKNKFDLKNHYKVLPDDQYVVKYLQEKFLYNCYIIIEYIIIYGENKNILIPFYSDNKIAKMQNYENRAEADAHVTMSNPLSEEIVAVRTPAIDGIAEVERGHIHGLAHLLAVGAEDLDNALDQGRSTNHLVQFVLTKGIGSTLVRQKPIIDHLLRGLISFGHWLGKGVLGLLRGGLFIFSRRLCRNVLGLLRRDGLLGEVILRFGSRDFLFFVGGVVAHLLDSEFGKM